MKQLEIDLSQLTAQRNKLKKILKENDNVSGPKTRDKIKDCNRKIGQIRRLLRREILW